MAKKARSKAVKKSTKKPASKPGAKGKPRASAKKPARKPTGSLPHPRARALETVAFGHGFLDQLLADVSGSQWTAQPDGFRNHPLWTMGHMATTYEWAYRTLTGKAGFLPESYAKLFGYQSQPTSDASAYPSVDDVRARYREAYDKFVAAGKKIKDEQLLAKPVLNADFVKDNLQVLDMTAWHDGWHGGQLASLRRALGLKSIMG